MRQIELLQTLLTEKKPIYFKNNLAKKGKFIIVFPTETGKPYEFLVPVTDAPLCLTDVIPHQIVANSIELRNFVTRGIVLVLTPEEAEDELKKPEVQEELAALMTSEFSASSKFVSQRVSLMKNVDVEEAKRLEQEFSTKGVVSGTVDVIQAWVKETLIRVDSGDLKVNDAVRTFRVKKDELSDNDLNFIALNSNKDQIKEFAKKTLSERQQSTEPVLIGKETLDEPLTAEEKRMEALAKARMQDNLATGRKLDPTKI